MARYAHVTSWGMALPEQVLTNSDVAKRFGLDSSRIQRRSGIEKRRVAASHETTTSLATLAAQRAVERTNLSPHRIELIIVASASPEWIFPATACIVQDHIGARHAIA